MKDESKIQNINADIVKMSIDDFIIGWFQKVAVESVIGALQLKKTELAWMIKNNHILKKRIPKGKEDHSELKDLYFHVKIVNAIIKCR